MKRFISIILAAVMLMSAAVYLSSCEDGEKNDVITGKQEEQKEPASNKVRGSLRDIYNAVNEEFKFDEKISEVIYKEEDIDEMVMMQYGIVDMEAADKLTDYVISMPSDYCNTFCVFVFDEMPSEDGIKALKEAVNYNYTEARASALQMYMPEEYAKMTWADENEDLTWREYDNALVFIITGDTEATDAFEAFEKVALK